MTDFGTYGLWAVRISAVFFLIVIAIYLGNAKRAQYAKFVKNKIKCKFILPTRDSVKIWLEVKDNTINIPKRGKNPPKTYGIADVGVYGCEYPEDWCPKFMRVQAKEALFDYNSAEPLSNNSGRPIVNPTLLYNRLHEKDSEIAMRNAEREGAEVSSAGVPAKLLGVYIVMAVIVIGIGVLIYFVAPNIPAIKDGIEAIRASKGI